MTVEKIIQVDELWYLEGKHFPMKIDLWGLLDIVEAPFDHTIPSYDLIEDVIAREDRIEVCTANYGDWEVPKGSEVTVVWST